MKPGKLTLSHLADLKSSGEKIVMVTAYDAPGARFAEQAGIDILLVGDTAGMVVLGHDGTVPVTMEEMLFLTRSVSGAVERPLIVGDMPFGSYHVSDEDAVRNAIRFVKEAGADVVKLEGAGPSLSRVSAIVSAGIGVMGHVGLTPQSETILGGFKTQGRTAAKAQQLLADALALEAAGCFAIVLEAVPVPVAARITESLTVPTIGIGEGPECDGQVLVPRPPRPHRGAGTALRQAVHQSRGGDRGALTSTPTGSQWRPSRRRSTRTRCQRRKLQLFSSARRDTETVPTPTASPAPIAGRPRNAGDRTRPRPPVHGASADHDKQNEPPDGEHVKDPGEHRPGRRHRRLSCLNVVEISP